MTCPEKEDDKTKELLTKQFNSVIWSLGENSKT